MAVSPVLTFLAAPIRHLGESVGAFYVGEKDVEFTPEDEEALVMFASQAALVIANARKHREERRARAGLETLVNTTPVGVLVFDARTGNPVSLNREARRIVNDLCAPGGSAEQLLEVLTFRRADGREISLEEFPLAQALSTGETVRAEEIVLQAPDGPSVTTLINATSIRSEGCRSVRDCRRISGTTAGWRTTATCTGRAPATVCPGGGRERRSRWDSARGRWRSGRATSAWRCILVPNTPASASPRPASGKGCPGETAVHSRRPWQSR